MTVNFEGGFDDFFVVTRDLDLGDLRLQKEEVSDVRWATLEETLAMLENGQFIPYPPSFLRFLFEARGSFDFPTK